MVNNTCCIAVNLPPKCLVFEHVSSHLIPLRPHASHHKPERAVFGKRRCLGYDRVPLHSVQYNVAASNVRRGSVLEEDQHFKC